MCYCTAYSSYLFFVGVVEELNILADTNLQVLNYGRKISYDLSCLSISKNSWARQITSKNDCLLAPHFRSDNSTSVPALEAEELVQSPDLSHEGYILKEMSAYAEIEKIDLDREVSPMKPTSDWVGTAGFSGLDVALSLSTIQVKVDFSFNLCAYFTFVPCNCWLADVFPYHRKPCFLKFA
jgi:hypothetical protein